MHVETLTNPDDVAAYLGCFDLFERAAAFRDAAREAVVRTANDFSYLNEH